MASSADATDVVGPVGSKVPTAAAGAAPSNTTQFLQRRKRLQRRLEEQGVRLPTTAVVNIDLADIDEDQKLYEDVEKKCMLLPLDEKSGQPAERFNQHVLLKELDAYVKRIRDGKLWDLVLTYYCALVKRFSELQEDIKYQVCTIKMLSCYVQHQAKTPNSTSDASLISQDILGVMDRLLFGNLAHKAIVLSRIDMYKYNAPFLDQLCWRLQEQLVCVVCQPDVAQQPSAVTLLNVSVLMLCRWQKLMQTDDERRLFDQNMNVLVERLQLLRCNLLKLKGATARNVNLFYDTFDSVRSAKEPSSVDFRTTEIRTLYKDTCQSDLNDRFLKAFIYTNRKSRPAIRPIPIPNGVVIIIDDDDDDDNDNEPRRPPPSLVSPASKGGIRVREFAAIQPSRAESPALSANTGSVDLATGVAVESVANNDSADATRDEAVDSTAAIRSDNMATDEAGDDNVFDVAAAISSVDSSSGCFALSKAVENVATEPTTNATDLAVISPFILPTRPTHLDSSTELVVQASSPSASDQPSNVCPEETMNTAQLPQHKITGKRQWVVRKQTNPVQMNVVKPQKRPRRDDFIDSRDVVKKQVSMLKKSRQANRQKGLSTQCESKRQLTAHETSLLSIDIENCMNLFVQFPDQILGPITTPAETDHSAVQPLSISTHPHADEALPPAQFPSYVGPTYESMDQQYQHFGSPSDYHRYQSQLLLSEDSTSCSSFLSSTYMDTHTATHQRYPEASNSSSNNSNSGGSGDNDTAAGGDNAYVANCSTPLLDEFEKIELLLDTIPMIPPPNTISSDNHSVLLPEKDAYVEPTLNVHTHDPTWGTYMGDLRLSQTLAE